MKKVLIAVVVLAAAGGAAYLAVELLTTERQRVERVVRRLARRLEKRDPAGFCQYLAEDYSDSSGFNRMAVRELLTRGLPQLAYMTISLEDMRVEVKDDSAAVEFFARVVAEAREHGDQPPWRWDTRVRLDLAKTEGEWRVRRAEYALPEIVRREAF